MGLDGGTIATRSDILRRSSIRLADSDNTRSTRGGCISHYHETVLEGDLAQNKWRMCALSSEPLTTTDGGVVACRRGNLYNTAAFEDFILREGRFKTCSALMENTFSHLVGPRDVTRAHLKWNADSSLFMCPASNLEANGVHSFVVLWRCGHVFCRRAIDASAHGAHTSAHGRKRRKSSDCPTCGQPYGESSSKDVVDLYKGSDERFAVRSVYDQKSIPGLAFLSRFSEDKDIDKRNAPSIGHTEVAIASDAAITGNSKKTSRRCDGKFSTGLQPPGPEPRPTASLPSRGWERLESKSRPGKFYYKNNSLKITQWEPPVETPN